MLSGSAAEGREGLRPLDHFAELDGQTLRPKGSVNWVSQRVSQLVRLTSSFNSFFSHSITLSRILSAERWLDAKMAMSSA